MYIESVQIGDLFRQKSQSEMVEVQIESWITEHSQLYVDLEHEETNDLAEHFNYEKPAFTSVLDETTQLIPGEKHVFKCSFSGVPLPDAEWFVDNQPLGVTR